MASLTKTQTLINEICKQGNLVALKDILSKNKINHEYIATKGFENAIYYGQLNIIEYLLTSSEVKTDIHYRDDYAIRISCHCGHLDSIKFLLTSPLLKEKADLFANESDAFRWAAEGNHIPVVKFLLDFPIDPHHISRTVGKSAFMSACDQNAIDSVKLISKLDKFNMEESLCFVNQEDKDGFQLACENYEHDSEIVEYLIMELDFKPNPRQQQYIIDNMDNYIVAFAYRLLSTKSLHENLNKNISDKEKSSVKLKI